MIDSPTEMEQGAGFLHWNVMLPAIARRVLVSVEMRKMAMIIVGLRPLPDLFESVTKFTFQIGRIFQSNRQPDKAIADSACGAFGRGHEFV